jgi:hypothetical protein
MTIEHLTGSDVAAIIAALASLVAAIGSTVAVIGTAINGRQIERVRLATNGMKDDLVRTAGEKAFAEGVKHGQTNNTVEYDAGVKQGEDNPRSLEQQQIERK